MKPVLIIATTMSVLVSLSGYAQDHVWLLGGGPDPNYSQAQIELNVLWAQRVLNTAPGKRRLHVYFNDGNDPTKDVHEWRPVPETKAALQPLARAFNTYITNGDSYRNHRIPQVTGSTDAGLLRQALEKDFAALKPQDRALLVFNGHGGYDREDTADNTIMLWNNSQLSVRDLAALLKGVNPAVPVRFVFTQCYAGGFARLVYPEARPGGKLAEGQYCGFFAESEARTAEGCSAGINTNDYRDYSTYFFAALAGRSRQGKRLTSSADRDQDGRVSLYEAHLYTLSNAHSTDLPRSTSEDYLERWQPWYLAWTLAFSPEPPQDNIYTSLARELKTAQGFDAGAAWKSQRDARLVEYDRQQKEIYTEQASLRSDIYRLQSEVRRAVTQRWPQVEVTHTRAYQEFLLKDLNAAQDFILKHADYPALATKQKRYETLNDELLENERRRTQLEKIEWLDKLGRLLHRFQQEASAEQLAAYARLLACEQQGL